MEGVIESALKKNLNKFLPVYLSVKNESYMHAVPKDSETHFKVVIVSESFKGLTRVQQHQKIYAVTQALMKQGLHALALHSFTPEEWLKKSDTVVDSPLCSKNN